MTISLGFEPIPIEVRLARDSDFVAALVAEGGWPAGARIDLVFTLDGSTTTWPATIEGDTAAWQVPAAEVATLLASRARQARLHYQDDSGGATLLWGVGPVATW